MGHNYALIKLHYLTNANSFYIIYAYDYTNFQSMVMMTLH